MYLVMLVNDREGIHRTQLLALGEIAVFRQSEILDHLER
jgi:hypothetical protein